jgi:hypothetical protein
LARGDIEIKDRGGLNSVPTDRWVTAAGTPSLIKAGEPGKTPSLQNQSILLVDADLTIGTDKPMTGVAAKDSTEVAAATGYSVQYVPLATVKWEMKAKTSTTADTQSEIDLLIGGLQVMDLTAAVFTFDAAAATAAANAFMVAGGDPKRATIWFRIRQSAAAIDRDSL